MTRYLLRRNDRLYIASGFANYMQHGAELLGELPDNAIGIGYYNSGQLREIIDEKVRSTKQRLDSWKRLRRKI